MARAQGARAQMALAFETVYGTPPPLDMQGGGFTKMPFASTTLRAEQPLLNTELLGYGWDLTAALALGDALGVPPAAAAELLPVIEAVMVAKLNERMASGGLEGRNV